MNGELVVSEADPADHPSPVPLGRMVQWSSSDGKQFFPASLTYPALDPGVYEIGVSQQGGLFFERLDVEITGLLRFPQTNSDRVIDEIDRFWGRGDLFRMHGLPHKRGILLYGPPGSGKSSTLRLLMADVVRRGGVVVKFAAPGIFRAAMRLLREIQYETPVVVLMEDLDSILDNYNQSDVLNILDGIDRMDRILYLATTNYPEKLGPRIINRPSRFDKRFEIGHPNVESRRMYLRHLGGDPAWAEDTEGFSLAHLQELFVAVAILGDEYKEAVETLRNMCDRVESEEVQVPKAGFHAIKGWKSP